MAQLRRRKPHKVEITVALIGTFGVLGAAFFANWDKLFPRASHRSSSTKIAEVLSLPLSERVEAARWVDFKEKLIARGQAGYEAVTFDFDEGGSSTYRSSVTYHAGKVFVYDFWGPDTGDVGSWRSGWKVIGWKSGLGTKHAIAVKEQ